MVSAWSRQNSLVLGQVKVDDKSNEITAIPELLTRLDIAGAVITIDAMGMPEENNRTDCSAKRRLCFKSERKSSDHLISRKLF